MCFFGVQVTPRSWGWRWALVSEGVRGTAEAKGRRARGPQAEPVGNRVDTPMCTFISISLRSRRASSLP